MLRQFAHVLAECATTVAVSLLGTLRSITKRVWRSTSVTMCESRRGILWRRARQPGCRAPIPRPENLGDTSRVPWRKLAKYQKPRRGCRRGFGWQCRGGSLPKLAMGQRGSGGRAVHLAINHLVARRSQEVQGRRHALPDSIPAERGGHQRSALKSRRNPVQFSRLKSLANGTSREVKPCRQVGKRNLTNTRANV